MADPVFGQFCLDHAPALEVIDRRDGPEGDGTVFLDCGVKGQPPRLLVTRAVGLGEVVYEGRSRVVRPLGDGGGELKLVGGWVVRVVIYLDKFITT